MRPRAELIWNGLLDVLYPPVCLVCGARQEAGALCAVCRRDVRPLAPPFCDRCGVPVPADALVCRNCAAGPEPPFAWSQAMGQYTGTLRRAIHRLKFDGKTALAEPLGRLLVQSLDTPTPLFPASKADGRPAFDAVVPIPLHPSRLHRRGFNQSELIARVLAREWGLRLDASGLRRVRRTRSQTELTAAERAENIRGAFAASEPLRFHPQRVLLVDDVLTTTATVREAARVIREAGAARVCVIALARG